MARNVSIFFLVLCTIVVPLNADETNHTAVTWQGFVDTRVGVQGSETSLELSQIEVGLTGVIRPWLSVDVTIAGDGADGLGLGAGYMTLIHQGRGVEASLVAGRFDVPLGLSSGWYGSPDTALPFSVMLNDAMVEGWNNAGCMGGFRIGKISGVVYLVEGGMESLTNTDSGRAGGARVAWEFVERISAAVSLATSRHAVGKKYTWAGCDLEAGLGPVDVALEYLAKLPDDTWEKRSEGALAQVTVQLGDLVGTDLGVTIRGEVNSPVGESVERALSFGITWAAPDVFRLTAAVRVSKDDDANIVLQALTVL